MQILRSAPPYDEGERTQLAQVRHHLIDVRLTSLFIPLPFHLPIEQALSRMIRVAYLHRNPADYRMLPESLQRLDALEHGLRISGQCLSFASSSYIIGTPGVGKSSITARLCLSYPQVIQHRRYAGRPMTLDQVVWLRLECPFDGSVKNLCLNFFQELDDLLGTPYAQRYYRCTAEVMLVHMARLAMLHSIGLIVIDEVQHLARTKQDGDVRLLNFFVQMENIIGVPIVLIGTHEAWTSLTKAFRQIRRGTGQGNMVLEPLSWGPIWDLFITAVWRYQYTKARVSLTTELSRAVFELSAGIPDFAIKLYRLAQHRLINARGPELVTVQTFQQVATRELKLASPVLVNLSAGNWHELQTIQDVVPIHRRVPKRNRSTTQKPKVEQPTTPKPVKDPANTGASIPSASANSDRKNGGNKSAKKLLKETALPSIVKKAAEEGTAPYSALRTAGYIRQADVIPPLE